MVMDTVDSVVPADQDLVDSVALVDQDLVDSAALVDQDLVSGPVADLVRGRVDSVATQERLARLVLEVEMLLAVTVAETAREVLALEVATLRDMAAAVFLDKELVLEVAQDQVVSVLAVHLVMIIVNNT